MAGRPCGRYGEGPCQFIKELGLEKNRLFAKTLGKGLGCHGGRLVDFRPRTSDLRARDGCKCTSAVGESWQKDQ